MQLDIPNTEIEELWRDLKQEADKFLVERDKKKVIEAYIITLLRMDNLAIRSRRGWFKRFSR